MALSIPQQKLFSKYYFPVTGLETSATTYPKLIFSTFYGGEDSEGGYGIVAFEDSSFYVTGHTESIDFPTKNAYSNTYGGERDAFITKFQNNGSLLWSSYFGGNDIDVSNDIAVAEDGSCYISGFTRSDDFPTLNAFNSTYSGSDDAFLSKFSANGLLLWSSYLGGNDWDFGNSIAVTTDGSCYVTGEIQSNNFPTQNAFDNTYNGGNFDAFVAKFAANGTLLWSSYLGGNENDGGWGIAATNDGSCYVTGTTKSSNFPTQHAYDTTLNGGWDVFITKFHANGSLLWSTFLGGTWWDDAWGIATASDGSCYVTGYTQSSDFPTKQAYNDTYGMAGDAFLAKFAANGTLLWSTFLGGSESDRAYDVTATSDGNCFVTGETGSNNFPNTFAYNASQESNYDVFFTMFSSEGLLRWSTSLGGERTDSGYGIVCTEAGSCYVVGTTYSADFPTVNAYDSTTSTHSDIFIMKFVDTILPSPHSHTVDGFLIFIAVMPLIAFIPVTTLIFSKKRK
jgi:hypothetical protein